MRLPQTRGPVTDALLEALVHDPAGTSLQTAREAAASALERTQDLLDDEDLQLALFCLYELHYSGIDRVDDEWEWQPELLAIRRLIEHDFESRLRRGTADLAAHAPGDLRSAGEVADALFELAAAGDGPSIPDFVARRAEVWQLRELLVHKSVYQLKEADPHTWAIPRLTGRPKAALVEIQADEYGGGRLEHMHSGLFATTMAALGLDAHFGTYVDWVPAMSLASVNAMSLFGLNRRLRGAIIGHLTMYEMDSSLPNRKYARGFRRLGFTAPATDYFDEHVLADAVHEQIAGRDLAGGLVEQDPGLWPDVLFGAASVVLLGGLLGRRQLDAWENGVTSLRRPLPEPAALRVAPSA